MMCDISVWNTRYCYIVTGLFYCIFNIKDMFKISDSVSQPFPCCMQGCFIVKANNTTLQIVHVLTKVHKYFWFIMKLWQQNSSITETLALYMETERSFIR